MHPFRHAATTPDKPAVIEAATGATTTYAQLDAASNRAAQRFRREGLQAGDCIALLLPNTAAYLTLAWGAQRAGLIFVCLSTKLTASEVDYILADSGAALLVADAGFGPLVAALDHLPPKCFAIGGAVADWPRWEEAVALEPPEPIDDERAGDAMLYSSGTTGRPKGVRAPLPEDPAIDAMTPLTMIAAGLFGLGADSVYLCPAPLYHAAPLRWSMTVHRLGGTVVVLDRFDAEQALAAIERYRCSAGQFVPTHFVRMLKLPEMVRRSYDVSTMRAAIHAAAPCPVPVKRAMIDWWGPVIDEYYAGSEGNGITVVKAAEWLERPGTVGRAVGESKLHICDDDGEPVPPRTEGLVYFEAPRPFEYHNDAAQTAATRNARGWSTLGDVGWVDEEGWLFLTDRRSFMIISGGVNIYPAEIESHLVTHPAVADVAVIGAPHGEMGEEVVAVIEPVAGVAGSDALAAELVAYARTALSGVKVPRRVDFVAALPRHDTGKLYKRLVRDRYWQGDTRIG